MKMKVSFAFTWSSAARAFLFFILLAVFAFACYSLPVEKILKNFLLWIKAELGPWGPLVLAFAYIPLTVFAVPASVLTLGGGYLFGLPVGFVADSIGATLGATAAFLVGKTIGRSYVISKLKKYPKFQAIAIAIQRSGFKIVLLLRFVPLLPFNVLNYLLSVTPVRLWEYILATWLGMMPITFVFVYIGTTLKDLSDVTHGWHEISKTRWIFIGSGLMISVIMIVYIIKVAKASLEKALAENGEIDGIDLDSPGLLPILADSALGLHQLMSVPKSAARMDYWREYFGSANANIFDIIEGAIMMAASDYPNEFRIRRDSIAQTLFSCRLIKCSGCDKEELALPVDDNADDDDDDDDAGDDDGDEGVKYKSKLTDVDGNWSKESSKVINSSRNDDDDDEEEEEEEDDDDDHHRRDVEVNEMNHHVSNYSYGDAEALTDEIEEESQMFDEVMRIKEIVDNSPDESTFDICNSLRKLQLMNLSVETLKATEIGKSVNVLRKHASKDVRQIAKVLIEVWKRMVDEWVKATTKVTVSEATPESMNPSVLDEEEGLPSPPLDDLAFLNPHAMSLELSEKFFDGMDDYGNLRKSAESNKNRDNNRKPPVEKQNITKLKEQKPLNGPTMARKEDRDSNVMKQQTGVKPTRPPVANLAPRIKPNDRKLQNPEKPTLQKRPIAHQQRKPWRANEESVQDKLEETKRKLQERYQQAENAKRQRTIQVMELHDLPKQEVQVDRKNQQMRPGNNHNRHWAHGRC